MKRLLSIAIQLGVVLSLSLSISGQSFAMGDKEYKCYNGGIRLISGECQCAAGYSGPSCQSCAKNYTNYPSCSYDYAAANCGEHGTLNLLGECECEANWSGSNCSVYKDPTKEHIASVPEASTFSMLLFGLIAMGLLRRRRKSGH